MPWLDGRHLHGLVFSLVTFAGSSAAQITCTSDLYSSISMRGMTMLWVYVYSPDAIPPVGVEITLSSAGMMLWQVDEHESINRLSFGVRTRDGSYHYLGDYADHLGGGNFSWPYAACGHTRARPPKTTLTKTPLPPLRASSTLSTTSTVAVSGVDVGGEKGVAVIWIIAIALLLKLLICCACVWACRRWATKTPQRPPMRGACSPCRRAVACFVQALPTALGSRPRRDARQRIRLPSLIASGPGAPGQDLREAARGRSCSCVSGEGSGESLGRGRVARAYSAPATVEKQRSMHQRLASTERARWAVPPPPRSPFGHERRRDSREQHQTAQPSSSTYSATASPSSGGRTGKAAAHRAGSLPKPQVPRSRSFVSPVAAASENPGKVAQAQAEILDQLRGTVGEGLESRKKVFRFLCLKWHPDKNWTEDPELATEVFQFLQAQKKWYLQ